MSKKDIKQNPTARQELSHFERMILLNYRLSPAFIVKLRESTAKGCSHE